jgi:predicted nucleic acid-binding protein
VPGPSRSSGVLDRFAPTASEDDARPTVVFDTDVLVAELAFPDESPVCVAVAEAGAVEVAVSPALLREFAAVLECALSAEADGVISDDAHLRDLDGIAGVDVLTRDGFLDRWANCGP